MFPRPCGLVYSGPDQGRIVAEAMVLVIPEPIWTICSVAKQAALCTNGVASFRIVPRSPLYLLSAGFLLR